MKTYSTGMGARLMFSTATAVEPEILVVDELLGVGDAYFAHKSFERMRRLVPDRGATLLLVTHDLYSAMDLCDRFVWIDRGQVRHEGDGRTTVAAYEASIKEQEETRFRARNRQPASMPGTAWRVVVRSVSGFALSEALWIERIALTFADGTEMVLPVAEGAAGWHLAPESNLGPVAEIHGRNARPLATSGRVYHKLEWMVAGAPALPASVRIAWLYEGAEEAEVAVLDDQGGVRLRGLLTASPDWQDASIRDEGRARSTQIGPVRERRNPDCRGHLSRRQRRSRPTASTTAADCTCAPRCPATLMRPSTRSRSSSPSTGRELPPPLTFTSTVCACRLPTAVWTSSRRRSSSAAARG